MPGIRTEITEIVTGLGTLGYDSALEAIAARPAELVPLAPAGWERLAGAVTDARYGREVADAWANGQAFLHAVDGLRRRPPRIVEWKGPQHPPGYDFLPADLRIDHVFLVSCKYVSKVLANPSPSHLFERALAVRGRRSEVDWFERSAPAAYRRFYGRVRAELAAEVALPEQPGELAPADRVELQRLCARTWPGGLQRDYAEFSAEVSARSAARWAQAAPSLADRELLLWRLLRFNAAPYFLLGSSVAGPLRLRVATPWDWRQRYELAEFAIAAEAAAQPRVAWSAAVVDRLAAQTVEVRGHVEIRWSHGRFCGHPEAKVYLDTPHEQVPGYFPLS
ncbi:MAG: hypothetical protein ACKVWR_07485 [Acidimicrobiales bacterium]